jgi:CheY-like chemotaxis protein/anti-sigma regulatory factor (Ser/Thr protein kinase)
MTANAAPAKTELDQLKGLFLASLTHEIRTPLSGILGMADLLLETPLDDEQREYVNAARMCAENLFEILNSSLEYAALEAGQLSLDESEFSLSEMIDAAVNQQQARARAKNLRLFATFEAGLPETMIGDGLKIRELLGHLLSNAVKFTHAGSVELRVSAVRNENNSTLILAVQDTGIGIPSDRLDSIFESFRQVEGGLSRTYPGLGLGLALARKLTSLMGGEIHVESGPGAGSTFTVRLPLRTVEEPASASNTVSPAVLVVEDNLVNATVLRRMLERRRLEVVCAASAKEALHYASAHRFDVVLMDVQMPDMDGIEATAELRKLPGYADVPILALTASSSDDLKEQCRRAGMQAFLIKPIDPPALWSAVSRYLNHPGA